MYVLYVFICVCNYGVEMDTLASTLLFSTLLKKSVSSSTDLVRSIYNSESRPSLRRVTRMFVKAPSDLHGMNNNEKSILCSVTGTWEKVIFRKVEAEQSVQFNVC